MTANIAATTPATPPAAPAPAAPVNPGLFGRLAAWILDLFLLLPAGLLLVEFMAWAEKQPGKGGLVYLAYLLVYLLAAGLAAAKIGSPGKWLLRQRLAGFPPARPRALQALLRTLPLLVILTVLTILGLAGLTDQQMGLAVRWLAGGILLFLGVHLAVTVFTEDHRSLLDLLARTEVVCQTRPAVLPRWDPAAPLLRAPRRHSISLWAVAGFQFLLVGLVVFSTLGQQYPDTLTMVATFLMVSVFVIPPLAGLIGAVLQQEWAKSYNAVFLLALAAAAAMGALYTRDTGPLAQPGGLEFLVFLYLLGTVLGACLLRAVPARTIVQPTGRPEAADDEELARFREAAPLADGPVVPMYNLGEVMQLLAGIAARYPDARSEFFPYDPHTGISLVFPVQPGISHPLFINCTGHDELTLSLGEAVFTFPRIGQNYPLNWFVKAAVGLLEGQAQVEEYRKDGEIIRADLKNLQTGQFFQRWHRFRFVPPWGVVRSVVRIDLPRRQG